MSIEVKLREFNKISSKIFVMYHEIARRLGLSDIEMDILYMLCEEDTVPQLDFYKKTGRQRSTINTALKRMLSKGWVTVTNKKGRSTVVTLTSAGRAVAGDTVERLIAAENKIFDSWTVDEQRSFVDINRQFMEKLEGLMDEI